MAHHLQYRIHPRIHPSPAITSDSSIQNSDLRHRNGLPLKWNSHRPHQSDGDGDGDGVEATSNTVNLSSLECTDSSSRRLPSCKLGTNWRCHLSCPFSVTIMKRQRDPPPIIEVDDDDDDEFEPLFNYSKTVVPAPTFLSDDSDEEDLVMASAPKRRPEITPAKEPSTRTPQKAPAKKVVLDDDDDDDDDDSWLMSSPPKLPKMPQPVFSTGNHALQQLREKRRELMMLQQLASPGAIRNIEELARIQAQQRPEAEPPLVSKTPEILKFHVEPPKSEAGASEEKEKVLIKVQDKSGNSHSIRIYSTDKFEKLFTLYAKMVKTSLPNLSFRFDGDQLAPNSTPKDHDMEDEDIIEVYNKSASG